MISPVTISRACEVIGGEMHSVSDPRREVFGANIDSREVRSGDLFFALKGKTDGADYARFAAEAGATAIVADRPIDRLPVIVVPDAQVALQTLARYSLEEAGRPKIVGITGTVGKTTTKDALAAMLRSTGGRTFATAGNFNNELGLPLTVLAASPGTEYLVLEMGATHTGDIAHLCGIARPDVGVLTAISPVHLDSFGSLEALAEAKGELAANVPEDGVFVSPSGVPEAAIALGREISGRIVFGDGGDLTAGNVSETGEGIRFTVRYGGEEAEVAAPVYGTHLVQPLLAAIGGGLALGLSLSECAAGAARVKRTGLRGELVDLRDGIVVYDDTYNASPAAMAAVLRYGSTQAGQQDRRFVAVLGGMFELGSGTRNYHREIGVVASEVGVDLLVCVGDEARWYAEDFDGESINCPDARTAADVLEEKLEPEDYVVIKGSRGVGLDAVTRKLRERLPLV